MGAGYSVDRSNPVRLLGEFNQRNCHSNQQLTPYYPSTFCARNVRNSKLGARLELAFQCLPASAGRTKCQEMNVAALSILAVTQQIAEFALTLTGQEIERDSINW